MLNSKKYNKSIHDTYTTLRDVMLKTVLLMYKFIYIKGINNVYNTICAWLRKFTQIQ